MNGLGDDRKRRKIFNYMKKHTSGKAIAFLQETHSVQNVEKLFEYQWRGKLLFSHGTSSSRGVCICFRYDLDYKAFEVINDKDGRYIIARMEIQGQPYVLINYYAPNSETGQVKIFKDIFKQLTDMDITPDYKYICAGDWNLIFDASMDSFGEKAVLKRKATFQIKTIMSNFELVDIWRVRNPTLRQFTWGRKTPLQIGRLDFFLISNDLQFGVKSYEVLCPSSSDHSPFKLKLQIDSADYRGRGYWKFSCPLLETNQYVCDMKNKISELISTFKDFDDPRVNWGYLKFKMREVSRNTAMHLSKSRKEAREKLEAKVKNFEKNYSLSADDLADYEEAKVELEKIYDRITDGIILRSKAQSYEEGEKASKYFLTLDKNRKAKTCITRLNSELNGQIYDPQIIMSEIEAFYSKLYKKTSVKREEECLQYLSNLSTPVLTEDEKSLCKGKLTLNVCWEALNSMKNGKSPRNDGFTKEFYVSFFGELVPLFLKTFNYSFEKGELSASQKQAVITLIQKKIEMLR